MQAAHRGPLPFWGAALCSVSLALPTGAQFVQQVLQPSDGQSADFFGRYVAYDGQRMLVGAQQADAVADSSGAAYVLEQQAGLWVEVQKLAPLDLVAGARFGGVLDIEGDLAAVGTGSLGGPDDALYIYRRVGGTWVVDQKLAESSPGVEQASSVSIEDGRVYVGCSFGDGPVTESGSVHVYEDVGGVWTLTQSVHPDSLQTGSRFGTSLVVRGERMLVGAPQHSVTHSAQGAAWIYERVNGVWTEGDQLLAVPACSWSGFGWSVDLEGERALVGAPWESCSSTFGEQHGAAYTCELASDSLAPTQRLSSHPSLWGWVEAFGADVALAGDQLSVSAPTIPQCPSGYVNVYAWSGSDWEAQGKLGSLSAPACWDFTEGRLLGPDLLLVQIPGIQNGAPAGALYFVDVAQLGAPFSAGATSVSLSAPQSVPFAINTQLYGPQQFYALVLGSLTGTAPGVNLGAGLQLDLVPDAYTNLLLAAPNGATLNPGFQILDDTGQGTLAFQLPSGLPISLVGTSLHHAALILESGSGALVDVTPTVDLDLAP